MVYGSQFEYSIGRANWTVDFLILNIHWNRMVAVSKQTNRENLASASNKMDECKWLEKWWEWIQWIFRDISSDKQVAAHASIRPTSNETHCHYVNTIAVWLRRVNYVDTFVSVSNTFFSCLYMYACRRQFPSFDCISIMQFQSMCVWFVLVTGCNSSIYVEKPAATSAQIQSSISIHRDCKQKSYDNMKQLNQTMITV